MPNQDLGTNQCNECAEPAVRYIETNVQQGEKFWKCEKHLAIFKEKLLKLCQGKK